MPTEGAPAATAARAYSICTSLPEGLQEKKKHKLLHYVLKSDKRLEIRISVL